MHPFTATCLALLSLVLLAVPPWAYHLYGHSQTGLVIAILITLAVYLGAGGRPQAVGRRP